MPPMGCKTDAVTERVELSPSSWMPPAGVRPAWNWTPPYGLTARLDQVPLWVRIWFRTPFVDRFAHSWMWYHGGWEILPPPESGQENSGGRSPLLPPGSRLHQARTQCDE